MSGFSNAPSDIVSRDGGVATPVANAGTTARVTSVPTPCRECYVFAQPGLLARTTYFAINTSVNVSLGATVPTISTAAAARANTQPLRVPIDDVSKLWFFSAIAPGGGRVQITYRT